MIRVRYSDGRVAEETWHANRMSADSNVIGNLRSRPAFRAGAWQQNGISSVEVVVLGTTGPDEGRRVGEPAEPREEPVADLIKRGESSLLEFKSTLQWDTRQNVHNKGLRQASLKTVNAFMNSRGGRLVIGVEDDGAICGLARDLSLTEDSKDKFEQLLINLIADHMGQTVARLVRVRFEAVGEESVCVVDVERASRPVFMKKTGKEPFYIRMGNTTRPLDHEEMLKYVEDHW